MVAFELARDMQARGFNIVTACPRNSRLGEKLIVSNLEVIDVDARKYFDPFAVMQLRHALKSRSVTNVVLHQLRDIWHVRPALLGHEEIRLSGFAHIFLSVTKKSFGHRVLYERLDDLICLTNIQKRNFASCLPVPADRIHVIPNAVDMTLFRPERRSEQVRAEFGASPTDILIGVIGRLDLAKGQIETINAAKKLIDEGLPVKIVLVGEETLNLKGTKALLEKQINDLQMKSHVRLAGFRSDTADIIASLDILAMPSWAETFGRVLLEAMASKTAVVATSAGGVPDIIDDGRNGLLVPPRNEVALADAFRRFVTSRMLRDSIREVAYETALRRYELSLVQTQLDKVLTSPRDSLHFPS